MNGMASGKECCREPPLTPSPRRAAPPLEHRLHRFLLQVRRVAVFVQEAFHHHANLRPRTCTQRPVDGHVFADLGDEFGGYDLEFVVTHRFDGALIYGELIIEGDFVIR